MSHWLIAVCGTIYAYVAAEQVCRGNVGLAIMYAGYAFAAIGAFILAGK